MDIVSDLPFRLVFYTFKGPVDVTEFSTNEIDIYSSEFHGIDIKENEEISILFKSQYESKLYLDALDIIPDNSGVLIDEENGQIYRQSSDIPFDLYKNDNEFDALRVDSFRITIKSNNIIYYSILNVLPSRLEISEWQMMRDDLENEIRGLAQDIVRKNIGLGSKNKGIIPPEKLYKFFVLKKYSSKLLTSLLSIQQAPRYQIITKYVNSSNYESSTIDNYTIRKYLTNGGIKSYYEIPKKDITYDVSENRLLKKIISLYDTELKDFIHELLIVKEFREKNKKFINFNEHTQYRKLYEKGLDDFINIAQNLQKITSFIKRQNWYNSVSISHNVPISHSFAMDSRYSTLYKMYQELKSNVFNVKLDPVYSYSWKKSSSLYEMWCYVKICRYFSENYIWENELNFEYGNTLFPYLKNETKMIFSNDIVQLEIIFDQFIPRNESSAYLHNHPFYTLGNHNRPDITIDIYDKQYDWYIGSIILECKYRRLRSIRSTSRDQIQSYYTHPESNLLFNSYLGKLNVKPIKNVIVLTPDVMYRDEYEFKNKVFYSTLRPIENDTYINTLMQIINNIIDSHIKDADNIKSMLFNFKNNNIDKHED